jgi:hypothetical protein
VFIQVWISLKQGLLLSLEEDIMKKHTQWWSWAILAGLVFILLAPFGKAQDAQVAPDSQGPQYAQNADGQDPPSRVARLNYIEGSVSFQPGGENDWVTAVLNRPLVTGDNLWADEDSRAEVHIGSTALRLGPKTGITLLEVSDRAAQIRLAQGSLIVKVRHVDDEDSYEIDTPNVAFVAMQPGDYRIDVDADGNRTEVTVWRGRGEVTGGGNSYTVVANQHAAFTSSRTDQLNYDLGQIPGDDGFDSWAIDRDQIEDRSDSANYVSREMTGYEDLDEYGSWSYVAGYGTVWQPAGVAVGWAPYRFGHWIWVGRWGWTWVEDEPWGFAPFHYGRWAFAGAGWVWVPGPSVVRPVYAPALVAWVGGGPGFRFSVGAGVGWSPLAPGEVFLPGYRVSRGYVNSVNISNTRVNITKVTDVYNTVVINRNVNNVTYANRNVNEGVTVVSHDTFVNARPVARNVVSVPARELAAAPVSNMVAVEPVRASVLGTGRPVVNRPPAAVTSRPVVALRTPAPMPRSFDQRQAQAGGHLNQQSSIGQSSSQQSLVRQEPPGRPVPVARQPQPQSQDGFHSFGQGDAESSQSKPQPRVWEAQGTPEPEKSAQAQPQNRSAQASGSRASQPGAAQPAQQGPHSLAKTAAPVQERNEQPQKPASAPQQRQQSSHPPVPKQESAPKK